MPSASTGARGIPVVSAGLCLRNDVLQAVKIEEFSVAVDEIASAGNGREHGLAAQTKQIGAHSAAGYDMEVSMQSAMGGSKDMTMTVTLSGPVWIVKNAPGSADYARFYKSAVEKGWIFSDPRGAKAQPGQAKAMAEMYRQMADIGGIPYGTVSMSLLFV